MLGYSTVKRSIVTRFTILHRSFPCRARYSRHLHPDQSLRNSCHGDTCVCSDPSLHLSSEKVSALFRARPPTLIEPGGTYAHSPSPEPPISGKRISRDIPPYLRYWLPLAITENIPFPGFLGKSSRDYGQKIPNFPRKWERACGPLMHSNGGPGFRVIQYNTILCIFVSLTEL